MQRTSSRRRCCDRLLTRRSNGSAIWCVDFWTCTDIAGSLTCSLLFAFTPQLLVAWAALPQQTRLTRILKSTDGSNAPAPRSLDWYQSSTPVERPREELFQIGVAGSSRSEDFFRAQLKPVIKRPAPEVLESYHYVPPPPPPPPVPVVPKKDISSLLAEAIAAQAESERKAVEKAELEAIRQAEERARIEALRIEKGKAREKKRKRVPTTGKLEPKGNEAHKEKRLLGLVGEVVVKSMSKYKDQMDHEKFKEYAKQARPQISRLWLPRPSDVLRRGLTSLPSLPPPSSPPSVRSADRR